MRQESVVFIKDSGTPLKYHLQSNQSVPKNYQVLYVGFISLRWGDMSGFTALRGLGTRTVMAVATSVLIADCNPAICSWVSGSDPSVCCCSPHGEKLKNESLHLSLLHLFKGEYLLMK